MYKYQGVGAEDFGPPIPTATQQVTQAMTDATRAVEDYTGVQGFPYYVGIALIGYVAYSYWNE